MPVIRWADGTRVAARTWSELEDKLPSTGIFDSGAGRMTYRLTLRQRARVWSKTRLTMRELTGSSERFIRGCARAGLMTIERGDER